MIKVSISKKHNSDLRLRALVLPDKYFECQDCRNIFPTFSKKRQKLNVNCTACKSEEILTFKELGRGKVKEDMPMVVL